MVLTWTSEMRPDTTLQDTAATRIQSKARGRRIARLHLPHLDLRRHGAKEHAPTAAEASEAARQQESSEAGLEAATRVQAAVRGRKGA